jgi:hypothetical protein
MLRANGRLVFAAVLFWLASPLRAVQPGDIVKDVDGLAVAAMPGGPQRAVLHGSPALVIGIRVDSRGLQWTRLLAADGVSGWTERRFSNAVPARVVSAGKLQLSDRSPDAASISEGIEPFEVSGKDVKIAGASVASRVASPRELSLPARLNPFLMPWLEIHSGSRTGWAIPSELTLAWGEPARGEDLIAAMNRLGFKGIARRPFLGPVQQMLVDAASRRRGTTLELQTISGKPVKVQTVPSISSPDVMVRFSAGWAALFSSARECVVAFGNGNAAVVREGRPILISAMEEDLNGDGRPELALALANTNGDGYSYALWLIDGRGDQFSITPAPLGGSSGEPGGRTVDAEWWIDGRSVWIARAEGKRVEYEVLGYPAGDSTVSQGRAYAVVAGQFPSREAAERSGSGFGDRSQAAVHVFPCSGSWCVGRIFERGSEADAWRLRSSLPAGAVRVVEPVTRTRIR